tara:strand:- start:117 stop:299 length:183 start_codon:yes stop_codon:yes gene_type:complete
MPLNNINHLLVWQHLLDQAQSLAARLPETGVNPDKLGLLPLNDLMGILAFLKRAYTEKKV